jgi:Flp pilus assembly protein CpaB
MKRNMVPLLAIAFVVAIISTGVFYGLFAGKLRSSSSELANRTLVVAARELDRGKVLESGDVRVAYIKGSLSGSFSKPEELVGATVVASVKENEPLLEGRVVLSGPASRGAVRGVPAGMRAVSIRVSESDGVASLLDPGSRIDIQAVAERNGNPELRTILQNVEVLSVGPPGDSNGGSRSGPRIIAVLTHANDADLVALADAGSRIRVTLRNPLDEETSARRALALPAVFQANSERAALENAPGARETAQKAPENAGARENAQSARLTPEHPVQLRIEVLAASPEAAAELNSKLGAPRSGDQLRVTAFQPGADASALVDTLKQKQELEVVSSRMLTTSPGEPIRYHTSAARYRLSLRFFEAAAGSGDAKLRVTPELSVPSGAGIETRQYDAELDPGANFLVEGLASGGGHAVLERLFPKQSWANRELIIFVKPGGRGTGSVAALNKSARGR